MSSEPPGGEGATPPANRPYQPGPDSPYQQGPGSPYQVPPYQVPPYQVPPYQVPPYQTPPYSAPSGQYPPGQYPPQPQQPHLSGPLPYPPQPQPYAPAGRPFDGPLPDAPPNDPQWGQPLSAAAPAPRAPLTGPLSKLALATLALGIVLGGGGLALVTGLVSLLRLRRSGKSGTGITVIGMALTAAWAVAFAVLYVAVISKPVARDGQGVVVRRGEVLVTSLRAGDCLEKWAATTTIGSITVVPCTVNHDAEVFATFAATGGATFPGDKAVTDEASKQCSARAKTALKAADAATAKVAFLKPVEASWKKNQKQITCVAKLPAPLGRSVRA